MSDANTSVLLADEKAYWIDSEHLGLLPDENIVREWRNIPLQARTECIAYLKARTTVTNPKTQTKAYSGVFRVLKIEDIVERNRQGGTDSLTLRETLADGYDSTLVGGFPRLADDTNIVGSGTTEAANIAHPGGTAPVQEDWRTITIRWKDLNHDALETIRAERSAVTAATLTVGTESKTGPWYLISRKPSWEEDGTGTYEEVWALDEWHMESKGKVGNTKVVVSRYVQNVPKDRVKTVLDAEIAACTGYGTQGYTYDQKVYWRDPFADIITEVSQAVKVEIAAFTAELDDSKTVSEKSGENLYDADVAAYEITTATQGHTIRTQKSRNSDGTLNASKTDALAIKQEIAVYDSLVTPFSKESDKSGKNLFDADVSSYAANSTQSAGTIERVSKTINNDGTYNATLKSDVAVTNGGSGVVESSVKQVDKLETELSVRTRNLTSEPTLPSDTMTEGVVSRIRKILNDYKLWDKEETTETAHYAIASGSYLTRYGTVYWWALRNATETQWNSAISAASLDSTTDNSAEWSYNRFSLRDGTIVKRPIRDTATIPGWIIGSWQYGLTGERKYVQAKKGDWYYRETTYTITEGQTSSRNAAITAINGGLASSPVGPSETKALSNGQYSYRRIDINSYGTWTKDESLSV